MPAPNITPLPTPPSRSQSPDTFSTDADTFLGALPDFATDANAQASYLDDLAVDVTAETGADAAAAAASAAAALVSENNAEAAAAAAAATADAELWVSGTTYAIGDNVFSPINYQTYRRITNGAGTTDPSLDGTNWTLLTYYPATPFAVLGNSTAGAELRLPEDTDNGNHYVALKAANAIPANLTFTLPATDGTSGQTLVTDGSGNFSFATPGATNFQEFTTSGTWNKPVGAQFVMVEAWGGGGGAASGRRGANSASVVNSGGTGGGGGAYVRQVFKASDLPSTVSVTVAAGGVGGAAITTNDTNGLNGTSGGNSTFGTLITARGGGNGVFTPATGGTGTGALGGQGGHSIPGSIRPGFGTSTSDVYGPAAFGPMLYRAGERFDTAVPSAGYAGGSGGGVGSVRDAYAGGGSLMGGAGGGAGGGTTTNAAVKAAQAGGCDFLENGGGGAAALLVGGASGGNGLARQGGGGGGTGAPGTAYSQTWTQLFNPTSNKFLYITNQSAIVEVSATGVLNSTAVGYFTGGGTPQGFILVSGTYVVASSTGVWTSTDLSIWTQRYTLSVPYIAYGNGRYVAFGTNRIAWSTDLVTWNTVTSITDALILPSFDGTRFMVSGVNNIYYSTDGATWTTVANPVPLFYTAVVSNGSTFLLTGFDQTGNNFVTYSSVNFGVSWVSSFTTAYTRYNLEAGNGYTRPYWFNGRFYVLSATSSSAPVVYYSTTGLSGSWGSTSGVAMRWSGLAFDTIANSTLILFNSAATNAGSWGASVHTTGFTVNLSGNVLGTFAGGNGGNGGFPAGGGGGGGGTLNGFNSGAGGAGGAGVVRVYSW